MRRTHRLCLPPCSEAEDTPNKLSDSDPLVNIPVRPLLLNMFHLFLVAAILCQHVQAADILVVALTYGSSWMSVAKIAEALASRGHVVTVVAHASQKSDLMRKWPTLQYETFGDPDKPPLMKEVYKTMVPKLAFSSSGALDLMTLWSTGTSALLDLNEETLSDKQLLTKLKNSHYDVVLTYAVTFCGPLVAQYLDLPLVCTMRTIGDNFTISAALARTDVWLYQSDLMFDFPKPMMPNMVSIAGHMAEDVKPLSEEMEEFVQSSGDDGVVLVTFGSLIADMPAEKADMLAAAFARLPQKVVWRYAGTPPPSLGSNTKTMEWVPQNDLLEAMYHGVPLVGMPLMNDAHDNIARVEARGMAVSLDIHSVTSEDVYQAITTVISNPRYKEKADQVSTPLRDQPQSPMERAVWWTEHVIKHGGLPHLRSRAIELPFYQYYLRI
ncbi:UGT2B4 [Branchiostoma lanceolatum]|uniref:UGT2B4 protein n=1 Tax=Branchiostoma lanceolatum TaxID=7740 RepID=A0A8K0E893_BRALA|nr:UGT2B4 [Branchiostoma lanceolatum]